MSEFADLAAFHRLGPEGVPGVVADLAAWHGAGGDAELAWRNELGG